MHGCPHWNDMLSILAMCGIQRQTVHMYIQNIGLYQYHKINHSSTYIATALKQSPHKNNPVTSVIDSTCSAFGNQGLKNEKHYILINIHHITD